MDIIDSSINSYFLHLQFKFVKLLQFCMTQGLLISIAFGHAYIHKMGEIITYVLTVIVLFEDVEGCNPGETSIADLPGVLKLRKELLNKCMVLGICHLHCLIVCCIFILNIILIYCSL